MLDAIERVRHDTGCTLIVVTHNAEVAARAGLVLNLHGGRLH